MNGITIQSWSTLQYGFFEETFLGNREMYPELNEKLESIAAKYGVSAGAAAAAFNLRIPGVGQAVIGSTKPARIMKDVITRMDGALADTREKNIVTSL